MVRSAAKNYRDVAVVTAPGQYAAVLDELKQNNGALTLATREHLAGAAFARTAAYDRAISAYFAGRAGAEILPATLDVHLERRRTLRYGENPHQQAAFYVEPCCSGRLHRPAPRCCTARNYLSTTCSISIVP